MTENEIARLVVDASVKVHSKLGPGLLESVYETVLAKDLGRRGLIVMRQVPIPIQYDEIEFDEGFRADIIVEGKVILELKSVEQLAKVHYKQLFTYLKLADKRLGLLLNFGADLMKEGIKRIANGMHDNP
jgi:GxxExxY protein